MQNSKCKIVRNKAGFTLVEMLAVVAIFIVIGTVALSILLTSFRTSGKTDIVTAVQQNGSYALTQMSKTLRNARGLIAPFPCTGSVVVSSISLVTPDNQQVTYSCLLSNNPPTISSNSASLLDTSTVVLSSCQFTCSQASKSDLPIVTVSFSLTQKSTSALAEKIASTGAVPFQTSIVLRNITR